MHRFTNTYATFYSATSPSPVHQGFSHYFSITQTTYISRPTTTFVQHSTSPQSFHRYTYALNNPLKYKDPSGELYLLDDILVFTGGFVMGYVGYGITTGDWGGKALVAGLGVGAVAELSYATLGVGSFAAGSLGTAGEFGASFAAGYGGAVIGNREQIKAASENGSWNGVLLSIGYGAVAGLSSGIGMNSYLSGNETNLLGKGVNEAKVFSNMARGLNTLLEKGYDADTRQWSLSGKDWRDVGVDLVAGFTGELSGQKAYNFYTDIISKNSDFLSSKGFYLTRSLIKGYSSTITQDLIMLTFNKNNAWHNQKSRENIFSNLYHKTFFSSIIDFGLDYYGTYNTINNLLETFYGEKFSTSQLFTLMFLSK